MSNEFLRQWISNIVIGLLSALATLWLTEGRKRWQRAAELRRELINALRPFADQPQLLLYHALPTELLSELLSLLVRKRRLRAAIERRERARRDPMHDEAGQPKLRDLQEAHSALEALIDQLE